MKRILLIFIMLTLLSSLTTADITDLTTLNDYWTMDIANVTGGNIAVGVNHHNITLDDIP